MQTATIETPTQSTSSGLAALDKALGCGGYPRGRIIEIFGPEASGHQTLALHAIRATQHAGGVAAFIDNENAFNIDAATACGVNTEHLLLSQPDFAEQALEIVQTLARSGQVELIVIDSVSALVPKAQLDGFNIAGMGILAQLVKQSLRELVSVVYRTGTTVMFLNPQQKQSPETTGGDGLKFYASIRIDVRRTSTHQARARVVKNKITPPFGEAEFEL